MNLISYRAEHFRRICHIAKVLLPQLPVAIKHEGNLYRLCIDRFKVTYENRTSQAFFTCGKPMIDMLEEAIEWVEGNVHKRHMK